MEEDTMKHAMKFAESVGGHSHLLKLCNNLRDSPNVCPKLFTFGWALLV